MTMNFDSSGTAVPKLETLTSYHRLTEEYISDYVDYIYLEESEDERQARVKNWTKKDLSNYFFALTPHKKICAIVFLYPIQENHYGIGICNRIISDSSVLPSDLEMLLLVAIDRLKELKATRATLRLTEREHLLPLADSLTKFGFNKLHTRIEFKCELADLPVDDGTPFEWISVSKGGRFNLEEAAKILEKAGIGDPDWDENDNVLELLNSYISDPEFKSTLDCIHIGLINGEASAITIAQVVPIDGWSRITYMGLLPKFRGTGLGQWVHRHGFTMMKSQGGKLYQGGTVRGNAAMEALFRKHGCSELRTMQEWKIIL